MGMTSLRPVRRKTTSPSAAGPVYLPTTITPNVIWVLMKSKDVFALFGGKSLEIRSDSVCLFLCVSVGGGLQNM